MKEIDFEIVKCEIDTDLTLTADNIGDKLYKIPNLHSKYLRLYYQESLVLEKLEAKLARLYKKLFKYYTTEVDYIVKPAQANFFIFGDDKYSEAKFVVSKQKLQVDYLERTLKKVNNLSFDIKNLVEWSVFQNGG